MSQQNRVNSQELQAAANTAAQKLEEARALLAPLLSLLTPEERQRLPKPPAAFATSGRALARAAIDHPVIAQSTGFDAQAVLEDLANVELLAPVAEKAEQVSQLLTDARLAWLAEAFVPSLQVYGVAKVIAKQNAEVQKLVDPLGEVFGTGRERKKQG